MPNGQTIDKWDMHKKVDLKESMGSSIFVFDWKSNKLSKNWKFEFERCSVYNVEIIFDDVEVKLRRVKTLVTPENFLTHPRVRFCFN